MTRILFIVAFLLGALAIVWIGADFMGTDLLALTVTLLIGLAYGIGCFEMVQFRQATATLSNALQSVSSTVDKLDNGLNSWLLQLHPSLQNATRLRIEGERIALPGPVFTPYLVGLLVMLGLLGTFIGMVVTLNGAVFALEGTTELQAIRSGLAAPIKGLGLAFGTSVAGVAASAMLGLISTLSRRERLQAAASLDQCIANEFRRFSLLHNRQETYKAMQFQAQALPQVAERLQSMADNMERMTQTLTDSMVNSQNRFQETATQTFTKLVDSVEASLKTSLAESGRVAGEGIKPVLESAMATLVEQSQQTQSQLQNVAGKQLHTLSQQFGSTADDVSKAWNGALQSYQQHQAQLVTSLDDSLQGFSQRFEQTSTTMLDSLSNNSERLLQQQNESDIQRLQQWTESLGSASDKLVAGWQQSSGQMFSQQQSVLDGLQSNAVSVSENAERTSQGLLQEWSQLLQRSGELVQQRMETEQTWLDEQGQRMQSLTTTIREELDRLHNGESQRAEAAVERLSALETTVASHLSELGASLEQPMTRLIETASQAPKAAAEVIEQLRGEISNNIERDNSLLQERQRIMEDLNAVLTSLERAASEQRGAIETLVTQSTQQLADVSDRFGRHVESETGKLSEMATNLEASAVEVSSVSEAFGYAVELFSETSNKLVENLSRVEESLDRSSVRSDEQLAYYVAQAREVIDLSMMSQKEIIQELRHKAQGEDDREQEAS